MAFWNQKQKQISKKELYKQAEEQYNNPHSYLNKNTMRIMAAEVHNFVVKFDKGEEIPQDDIISLLTKYMTISAYAKKAEQFTPIKKDEVRKFYEQIDTTVFVIKADLEDPSKYILLENNCYKKV